MSMQQVRWQERGYCDEHPLYFVSEYVKIEDKQADQLIQPFKLWPAQQKALADIASHRLTVILKARQLGLTWLVLAYAAKLLFCQPGRLVVALSRTEEEAKELVRRLGVILGNMPALLASAQNPPPNWQGPVWSATTLTCQVSWPGQPASTFKAFASAGGAARSFTADLVILDEWAFQQAAREIWASAYPTINRPSGGQVIGLSTIERGSLFEEIFLNPHNGFHKIFLPWNTDPRRDSAWYNATLQALGRDLTWQEYPSSVEQALTIPGGAFFPEVQRHLHLAKPAYHLEAVRRYVCLDYGLDMLSVHWVYVDADGFARVYREFDAPDLVIQDACREIIKRTGDEEIDLYLAPPDLWNREQVTGKSRADLFWQYGVPLTKTSNDFAAGCAGMKSWLSPRQNGPPALTIDEGAAPRLYHCLVSVQKDKDRPNVYAKQPHDLTHDLDSLRCFCVYWVNPAKRPQNKTVNWTDDQWEDYQNANAAAKRYLIGKWGEPKKR